MEWFRVWGMVLKAILKSNCSIFRIGLDGHPEIGRQPVVEGERRPRMP
jgi:hypothetical protein